jgi:succinoglycan biosynthesis transport protein ExoP
MAEPFDALRYISYMRSRLPWIAATCGIAIALALCISLLLPRQYTATARIVIEPPAGSDPRSAMAISPIYLESLKTYEQFASSDSLFWNALDRFGLRRSLGSRPIESLKKRILKVGIVRNTRILEISATLPDAAKAQKLALFLAESTVDLNRGIASDSSQDLIHTVEQQEAEASRKLQETETAWSQLIGNEPVQELQSSIESAAELRAGLQQQIANAGIEIADTDARLKQGGDGIGEIRKEAANARARVDELRKQIESIDRQSAEREKLLAARLAHREKLESQRKTEQATLTAIETRLRETRSDAGSRGERLRIIDPGIIPERPSSPNLPLNLAVAMLLGLVLPILYFTLALSYQSQRTVERRSVYQR